VKNLFLLSIFLFGFQIANAQFALGVDGGLNISNGKFVGFDIQSNTQAGFYLNLSPCFAIGEKFSFLADVSLCDKGFELTTSTITAPSRVKLLYLSLSPKIEYKIVMPIGIAVGVYSGLKFLEAQKLPGGMWQGTTRFGIYKSLDYGIAASLNITLSQFQIRVTNEFGVNDIGNVTYTDFNGQPLGELSVFNRSFKIGLGYIFN